MSTPEDWQMPCGAIILGDDLAPGDHAVCCDECERSDSEP
jgi:hypothetical protein